MNATADSRSATSRGHRNAPLTPEGRLRLCLRVDTGRPIAHVAAEAGISRRCLAKRYARWLAHGEDSLMDRSSRPIAGPNRTSEDIADLVEALRRQTKYGPARLVYTEALDDEKAVTAAAFWHRSVAFFAAHDITPIRRVLTTTALATAPAPGPLPWS